MRIWFAGLAVETVVVTLWLEFVSYFHWWMQTVLYWWAGISISGICFHGNLFSLVLHLNVAFAVWVERIAPTAYDAVGEVMVWIAIRWEKCLWDFPETPSLCLFGIRVCFLSSGWWKDQQRVKRSWARFSSRKANEKADIWRGRDNQNTFWLFLSSLGLFWFLVSRLETIYEDRFYLKLWNPKLT